MTTRIWTYLVAAWLLAFLLMPGLCFSQWIIQLPSYRTDVRWLQGGPNLQGAHLVSMSYQWWDERGMVQADSVTCALPQMNTMTIGTGHPGTNWLVTATCYSDGSQDWQTNVIVYAGFKIYSVSGGVRYGVKSHLRDYEWTAVTNSGPVYGHYDAPEQWFRLVTNNAILFYRDSLPQPVLAADRNLGGTATIPVNIMPNQ